MVYFKPFLQLCNFPNFKLKIKLGALLLCLSFFLNYHPAFTFPPIERNIAYAEIAQEQQINSAVSPVVFGLPHPGYITTTFSAYHPGIDLCSGLGMPIKPVAKGVITEAGFNFFGLGLMVEVEHEGGYKSIYGHMGKIFVAKGQTVEAESFLGEIGMTGHTSGPHTHLEISKDGKKINPLLVLPEIRKYPKEEDFVVIKSATPSAVSIPSSVNTSATGSAKPKSLDSMVSQNFIKPLLESEKITTSEIKPDLARQSLYSLIASGNPKPKAQALPQGGAISLKNLTLFGFKR